ncbi:hypothetical protein [Flagellimonas algicola]|uniref:Uncharacterized protein n=1 Tax=Flagellimonas algicola TaxID=2583815 RepID=A0ABY2WPT3_9FLAO|nr:hypothetical protein [Allomuricauda algicola]TMU56987.1 hypothetical protein FGG15_05420 [Allomuricauda algicola]
MKTLHSKLFVALAAFAISGTALAQEKTTQAYWVHEDRVKPSMVMEYEKVSKELTDQCKEHNIQTLAWISTQSDDFRYLFVSPIDSLSDISKANKGFGTLRDKMGEEAFDTLFDDMGKCYDAHGDYVIVLDKSLSYMPEGITQTPEGQDYRRFYYLHTTPAGMKGMKEGMQAVKKMYEDKGSKRHYRVYRSGFGTMGSFYMVAIAAKDGVSYEMMGDANEKLLGPEAQAIYGKVMQHVTKMEEVTGKMRPDLAYSPK